MRGPRASSAFAVTAAALVAGVAGMSQAPELSAGFVEAAAQELEAAGHSNDRCACVWVWVCVCAGSMLRGLPVFTYCGL